MRTINVYVGVILFLFFAILFIGKTHAGAAEDRTQSIIDQALSTKKYSSASGSNYTVGGVKADNGKLVATVAQRVVVNGSAATVTQKVTIPANDAFYKKTAGFAKSILRGGAIGVVGSLAMQKLLDGVGYVMDEGGAIRKIDTAVNTTSEYQYTIAGNPVFGRMYTACQLFADDWKSKNSPGSQYPVLHTTGNQTITDSTVQCFYYYYPGAYTTSYAFPYVKNPNYNKSPPTVSVPDPQIDDAFSNWFKNNPSSVTDPVTTYIYSPKTPTGAPATTPQNDPSWGQQEITDDMMNNYLENRNAELYANDVAANQAAIRDSAQTETESNPDGTKTETKPNPDGSKTETKTETKTNPDTGEVETTVTETVINPDGSRGESKETVNKTETKPNPEKTDLPAVCEYFAFLCQWTKWTQEEPDLQDKELEINNIDVTAYKRETHVSFGRSCPFSPQMQSLPMGILGSIDFETDLTFICEVGDAARIYVQILGHLGALIYLLVGLRNGNA